MKQLLFLLLFLIPVIGVAQVGDFPDEKPLKIEAANKLDKEGKEDKGTALRIPDVIKEQPKINFKDSMGRKPVKMLDDRKLVQAGAGIKIQPKFMNSEKSGSKEIYGDMSLGEITTTSRSIGIMVRDHSFVDGDRIKIWVNNELIEANILLIGMFKALNVELNRGLNTIEFQSLSVGSVPPNSAQMQVYDEKEILIYNNYWGLSDGATASFTVIREMN